MRQDAGIKLRQKYLVPLITLGVVSVCLQFYHHPAHQPSSLYLASAPFQQVLSPNKKKNITQEGAVANNIPIEYCAADHPSHSITPTTNDYIPWKDRVLPPSIYNNNDNNHNHVVRILAVIMTRFEDGAVRMAHRQTWIDQQVRGKLLELGDGTRYAVDVKFVVAQPSSRKVYQTMHHAVLRDEQDAYGDLLLVPHPEPGQHNLAQRVVWSFEAAMTQVQQPHEYDYYFKIDQDAFPVWCRMLELKDFIPRQPEEYAVIGKHMANHFLKESWLELFPHDNDLSQQLLHKNQTTGFCAGGELYGVSRTLLQHILRHPKVETMVQRLHRHEDVAMCILGAWVVQDQNNTSWKRHLIADYQHENVWVHAGALKHPLALIRCMTDPEGCDGENGNRLVHSLWTPEHDVMDPIDRDTQMDHMPR